MPSLKAAHIRAQGLDTIIVPLDRAFGQKSDRDKSMALGALERRGLFAELAGRAVAYWQSSSGRHFRGRSHWRPLRVDRGWVTSWQA